MADDLEAFLKRAAELRREKAAALQQAADRTEQRSAAARPKPYSDRARERQPMRQPEAESDHFEPTPLIDRYEDEEVIVLSEASIVPNPDPIATPATPRAPIRVSTQPVARSRTVDGLIKSLKSPEGLRQAFMVREILDRKHF